MTKKNTPKTAVPTPSMIRYAPRRFRLRSNRTGSSACRLRASMTVNAASSTAAADSAATTLLSPQWDVPSGPAVALDRP